MIVSDHWFNYGYVGKQPVAWKEYCAGESRQWLGRNIVLGKQPVALKEYCALVKESLGEHG